MPKMPEKSRDQQVITDWTAVAQNTVGESGEIDVIEGRTIGIQAFLDSATAHTGTEFVIQINKNTSGNEDWLNYTSFVALVGTANAEAITNNPLAAASTTIAIASTTGYTVGDAVLPLRAIEDATLANSEIITQIRYTTNASIAILDGTTNAHVQNTNMYNIAISETIEISDNTARRGRVIVNNTYDSNGSTLNYRVLA